MPEQMQFHRNIPIAIHQGDNDAWLYSLQSTKPYLFASYEYPDMRKARYCYQADPGFKRLIITSLITQPLAPNAKVIRDEAEREQ